MSDLVVDRAVLTDVAWRLREGMPLPHELGRLDGRVFYERPGMSALETLLFEHKALAFRLAPLNDDLDNDRIRWLVARAVGSHDVQMAASNLNRESRVPGRTPEQLVEYIVRLLAFAVNAEADLLMWELREPILLAFLSASGVPSQPAGGGLRIGDELLSVLAPASNASRTPFVWKVDAGRGAPPDVVNVFISYAHEDSRWRDRVRSMLRTLELLGTVHVFSDADILPGRPWEPEIVAALERADAIIALVSEHYLGSEFVMAVELPVIIARVERGDAALWWYLLAPCMFEHAGLARIQAAHDTEVPLDAADPHEVGRLLKACARGVAAIHPRR